MAGPGRNLRRKWTQEESLSVKKPEMAEELVAVLKIKPKAKPSLAEMWNSIRTSSLQDQTDWIDKHWKPDVPKELTGKELADAGKLLPGSSTPTMWKCSHCKIRWITTGPNGRRDCPNRCKDPTVSGDGGGGGSNTVDGSGAKTKKPNRPATEEHNLAMTNPDLAKQLVCVLASSSLKVLERYKREWQAEIEGKLWCSAEEQEAWIEENRDKGIELGPDGAKRIAPGGSCGALWRCGKCQERWVATPGQRLSNGCPACPGNLKTPGNCLQNNWPSGEWSHIKDELVCFLKGKTVAESSVLDNINKHDPPEIDQIRKAAVASWADDRRKQGAPVLPEGGSSSRQGAQAADDAAGTRQVQAEFAAWLVQHSAGVDARRYSKTGGTYFALWQCTKSRQLHVMQINRRLKKPCPCTCCRRRQPLATSHPAFFDELYAILEVPSDSKGVDLKRAFAKLSSSDEQNLWIEEHKSNRHKEDVKAGDWAIWDCREAGHGLFCANVASRKQEKSNACPSCKTRGEPLSVANPEAAGELVCVLKGKIDELKASFPSRVQRQEDPGVLELWQKDNTLLQDGSDSPVTAEHITSGQKIPALWMCQACQHLWVTQVYQRKNHGCPECGLSGWSLNKLAEMVGSFADHVDGFDEKETFWVLQCSGLLDIKTPEGVKRNRKILSLLSELGTAGAQAFAQKKEGSELWKQLQRTMNMHDPPEDGGLADDTDPFAFCGAEDGDLAPADRIQATPSASGGATEGGQEETTERQRVTQIVHTASGAAAAVSFARAFREKHGFRQLQSVDDVAVVEFFLTNSISRLWARAATAKEDQGPEEWSRLTDPAIAAVSKELERCAGNDEFLQQGLGRACKRLQRLLPESLNKEIRVSTVALSVMEVLADCCSAVPEDAPGPLFNHVERSGAPMSASAADTSQRSGYGETGRGGLYEVYVCAIFLGEYFAARALDFSSLDHPYQQSVDGKDYIPTLMQRLTVCRMCESAGVGNWSETGTGKTLSALLASRVVGASAVIILCPKRVVGQWESAIIRHFPSLESSVQKSTLTPVYPEGDCPRYLILNWQHLQQLEPDARKEACRSLLKSIWKDGKPVKTKVIIDEVHQVKVRQEPSRIVGGIACAKSQTANSKADTAEDKDENERKQKISKRREAVDALLYVLRQESNQPELWPKVLALTATPVINNLDEAASLVRLLTGQAPGITKTSKGKSVIFDCMTTHMDLMRHGFRFTSSADWNVEVLDVDCTQALRDLPPKWKFPLDLEYQLTKARLPAIVKFTKEHRDKMEGPLLIYTKFIGGPSKGKQDTIRKLMESAFLDNRIIAGFFTGSEDAYTQAATLQRFRDGKLDVMVGTDALITGTDGLQNICSTLLVNHLPWTHADFTQAKGRLDRTGQENEVRVVVLLASPSACGSKEHSELGSWDRLNWERINFKRSISDVAVDGRVPGSEEDLKRFSNKRMRRNLLDWLDLHRQDSQVCHNEGTGASAREGTKPHTKDGTVPKAAKRDVKRWGDRLLAGEAYHVKKAARVEPKTVPAESVIGPEPISEHDKDCEDTTNCRDPTPTSNEACNKVPVMGRHSANPRQGNDRRQINQDADKRRTAWDEFTGKVAKFRKTMEDFDAMEDPVLHLHECAGTNCPHPDQCRFARTCCHDQLTAGEFPIMDGFDRVSDILESHLKYMRDQLDIFGS